MKGEEKMKMCKSMLRKRSAVMQFVFMFALGLTILVGSYSSAAETLCPTTGSGWAQLPTILNRIVPPTFRDEDFVITKYGAVGDGVTDCNPAFKKAIAACTRAGGGRVVIPKGTFLTNGPIHLDNNVNLHATKDAVVKFGTNFKDYLPHVRVRWEGTECYNYSPLIYAYKKTNIAITGTGEFNGQAEKSWSMWPNKTKPGTTSNSRLRDLNHNDVPVADIKIYAKPTMIEPFDCTNVLIEGVTLKDYPFWCVHPTFCTNVTIRKLIVDSHNSNNDGINPDSSRDVLIEDCWLDQSDDCLAIKAGRDNSAWRAGRPCENIVVRNMPSNFGGVAIGSEMSGGVQNVFLYDCEYNGRALYCKSNLDRGGFIKDIYVKNLKIGNGYVLNLRNNYHGYKGGNFPTEFHDIYIEDVTIENAGSKAISISGVESAPVYDVFLKNITIGKVEAPFPKLRHAKNIVFTNVVVGGKLQPTHPALLPPEEVELAGSASISPKQSGTWSDVSIWDIGRDGGGINWGGTRAGRLPDGSKDERVLIGKIEAAPTGVTVILDVDVDDKFEIRIYENSTLVIPSGSTLKIGRSFIVDRHKSLVRQHGGALDVSRSLEIDAGSAEYVMSGGSMKIGGSLDLNEGKFIVDDSADAITSISIAGEFKAGNGTTTAFFANSDGVTPIQCKDVKLESYMGEKLIVNVSRYNYKKNGDLVLFSYTGTRTGKFDGGLEDPTPKIIIIGDGADVVYDDAAKKIKLTNFGRGSSGEAVMLFDGTDLSQWTNPNGGPAKWKIIGDAMEIVPQYEQGIQTKEKFQDFELHVEFMYKSEYKIDSGVYLQNRYEIQIKDSFGAGNYDSNISAAIHRQKDPDKNVSKKPGEWQSFDIMFTAARFEGNKKIKNARITMKHNGVLVHKDVEILGTTGHGQPEGPEPGHITLQEQNGKLQFRNIWIKKL